MTIATIPVEVESEQRIMARFTPKQRRQILRRQHGLFAWLTSDRAYTEMFNRFEKDAQRRYFATISRVTVYDGPDYRVRFSGQRSWVRATPSQYEQALAFGMERSIGIPDFTADIKALAA